MCWACCFHVKSNAGEQTLPAGVERKFGEEVPAQASSSSSDSGSKFRDSSQDQTPKCLRERIVTVKCEFKLFFVWSKFKENPFSLSGDIRKKCSNPKVFTVLYY
ncbi:hypothetical protein AVEN_175899-1 [Araneus ventricosus]|uniref:Uncharacterized protein n=1 Tax=Araneus ventricosus TaxID=182803 RepID=A0A4Y2ED90_ARAVE|nr:hypothetical protein AVEN_175899-1 [Araneus ventricosus]